MTIAEIMKQCGIQDDTVQKVVDAMKENGVHTTSVENADVRYNKLKADHEASTKELSEARGLIDSLKKAADGQNGLQEKIKAYEQQVQNMQKELQDAKVGAALKYALLENHAQDVDYLTYKLTEKMRAEGTALELDENGGIRGIDDKMAGLKTAFPKMFAGADGDVNGMKVLDVQKLHDTAGSNSLTRADVLKKPYAERAKLAAENPEGYAAAMATTNE